VTKKPDRVITGTKSHRQVQVVRGQKDVRQVRCTNKVCGALVSASPDGKGGQRHKCHQCGTLIISTRI
jgi:hypothetical protein